MSGNAVIQPLRPDGEQSADKLPPSAALLFAPIDKRAFGVALGAATALLAFAVTAAALTIPPEPLEGLGLLAQYFRGYSVSWTGALTGAVWGFATGFCAGWLVALTRNIALAVALFTLRTRADLAETRDFLDHI